MLSLPQSHGKNFILIHDLRSHSCSQPRLFLVSAKTERLRILPLNYKNAAVKCFIFQLLWYPDIPKLKIKQVNVIVAIIQILPKFLFRTLFLSQKCPNLQKNGNIHVIYKPLIKSLLIKTLPSWKSTTFWMCIKSNSTF